MRELEGRSDRGQEAPGGRGSEVPALRGRGGGAPGGLQAAAGDARQPRRSGRQPGAANYALRGRRVTGGSLSPVPGPRVGTATAPSPPPPPLSGLGRSGGCARHESVRQPRGAGGKRSGRRPHL